MKWKLWITSIIAIIVLLVIFDSLRFKRTYGHSQESYAFHLILRISTCEEQYKLEAIVDQDKNGVGEYGYLQDILNIPNIRNNSSLFYAWQFKESFAEKLIRCLDPISSSIREKLSIDIQQKLRQGEKISKECLVNEMNRLIQGECVYKKELFANVQLSQETITLLDIQKEKPLEWIKAVHLNRLLLEDAYPDEIVKQFCYLSIMPYFFHDGILSTAYQSPHQYNYCLYLPGDIEAIGEKEGVNIKDKKYAPNQEKFWICYAWPHSGKGRVFACNQVGEIFCFSNLNRRYYGYDHIPPAYAALSINGKNPKNLDAPLENPTMDGEKWKKVE